MQVSNEMTTPRPHKNVPQTGNIHLISHTPPRCGANRSVTQRHERRSATGLAVSGVMSDHPYAPHTRCSIESVDVPSSGRSTTGRRLPVFSSMRTPQVHVQMPNNKARSVNAFPRVDMLSLLRLTRSKYSWPSHLRPKIHRPVHLRLAVCQL